MPGTQDPNGQNTAEEKQPEAVSTSTQTETEVSDLPEEASDRTREQFDKLKQHNKELSERLQALEKSQEQSVFDVLHPPVETKHLNQDQVGDIYSKLVDENGYIDQNLLIQTLKAAEDRARKAEENAFFTRQKVEQIEESAQVRRAHKLYPQLDPKSTEFDQNFYEAVKDRVVRQMMNGEKDLVRAATEIAKFYPFKKVEAPSTEALEKKNQQVRNIQATSGSKQGAATNTDYSELVRKTQAGDRQALMERLNRIGS